MDDFGIWWYIIAAVLYFLTSRKKKKQGSGQPNGENRPQRTNPAKSFEDLLREITEGSIEEPEQTPIEVVSSKKESIPQKATGKNSESIRLEGERRHFSDAESKQVYEDSIKMAEGAQLSFEPAENYTTSRIFKNADEEDEWTIADDIRDGLTSDEAKKAIIYSEILNRKY